MQYSEFMISVDDPRTLTSLRTLCDVAGEHGIELEASLNGTGLKGPDLQNPELQVEASREMMTVENVVQHPSAPPGLGILVGKRMHVHAFGIWGFAILTSPTIRNAVETSIEFEQLSYLMAGMSLSERDDLGIISFEMHNLSAESQQYVFERHSFVTMSFIKELLQKPDFDEFTLEMKGNDQQYASRLADLLGLKVNTGASSFSLTFPAKYLDQSLPKSDPVSLQYCLNQCKSLVEEISGAIPLWSRKVRDSVIDKIGSELQIEDVASALSVSERTLRRRLTEEGTTFRDIYIDARMTIAHELLQTAGLNVETVSWRVGYAEPASFVRAFSKKYGKNPGEVRKQKRQTKA